MADKKSAAALQARLNRASYWLQDGPRHIAVQTNFDVTYVSRREADGVLVVSMAWRPRDAVRITALIDVATGTLTLQAPLHSNVVRDVVIDITNCLTAADISKAVLLKFAGDVLDAAGEF